MTYHKKPNNLTLKDEFIMKNEFVFLLLGQSPVFHCEVFPPFGKQEASKDRIYDAIAVGLGNGIFNKLPMLKNSFL